MENCPLYFRGNEVGRVTLRQEGGVTLVRAVMAGGEKGICRAVLVGERGERLLGVMEPHGRELVVTRRLYTRDVLALGQILRGEVRTKDGAWQRTDRPSQLLTDPLLRRELENCRLGWWRREGERLRLALPLERGRPFPLVSCFCLAHVGEVEGRRCAVFSFDGAGKPTLEE